MLDDGDSANITMPANIDLFNVSIRSTGKGIKYLHS